MARPVAQRVFDLTAMIHIASRRGLHHFKRIADRLPTMVKSAYFRMPLFKPGTVVLLESKRETISYIIVRRNLHNKTFNETELKNISNMFDKVNIAYDVMITNMALAADGKPVDLISAQNAEVQINQMRNDLRDEEMYKMEGKGDFLTSVYYLDLISELERMGDYIINVSQALR